jgi:hypothetical protein
MNKTLSFLAVLLIAFTGTALSNNPDDPASGVSILNRGETIKLFYKGTEQNNVKVFILDETNQIVFSETIRSTSGFARPYNFSQLPEGNYRIELVDGSGRRQVSEVNYTTEQKPKVIHVARLSGSEDKYILSVPKDGASKLSVKIYDNMNRILHKENQTVDGDFARIYNIKDYSGRLTFEVTDSKGRQNHYSTDNL